MARCVGLLANILGTLTVLLLDTVADSTDFDSVNPAHGRYLTASIAYRGKLSMRDSK